MDVVTYALAQKYVKNAIGSLDTVTDVTVDGNSVVNEDGVAEIVTPQILGEVADVKVNGQSVVDSEGVANITMHDTTLAKNFADEYDASTSYEVGDLCIKDLVLYRCTTATTGTWDDTKWEEVTVDGVLDEAGKVDDVQTYGGNTLVTNKIADLSALTIKKSIPSTPTDIANFTDGAEMVMPSLTVGVDAVQDLHGYDAPWVGGAGKNKLPYKEKTSTINGATFTINIDGTVSTSGTATSSAFFVYYKPNLPTGEYKFFSNADATKFRPYVSNATKETSTNSGGTFSVDEGDEITVYIQGYANQSLANQRVTMMICKSTETDTSWEPYSNICPISGHTEADVTRTGKNRITSITEGIELNAADGTTKSNSSWYVADYSRVEYGKTYYVSGTSSETVCYYDRYKNFTRNSLSQRIITPQEGECYVRVNSLISGYAEPQIEEGNEATSFSPFGTTYTIDLDGTRYGGVVDVVSGVLTVDRAEVDMGDLTWTYSNGFFRTLDLNATIKRPLNNYAKGNILSSEYVIETWNAIQSTDNGKMAISSGINDPLIVCNTDYTDATAFKTAMNGVQLVYELATPLTIQLTPTAIKSLEGENNLFADSGEILDGEYLADASTVIAGLDARITALENV